MNARKAIGEMLSELEVRERCSFVAWEGLKRDLNNKSLMEAYILSLKSCEEASTALEEMISTQNTK